MADYSGSHAATSRRVQSPPLKARPERVKISQEASISAASYSMTMGELRALTENTAIPDDARITITQSDGWGDTSGPVVKATWSS